MIVFHYSTIYLLTYRNLGLGLQGLYSATNGVVTIMNKQQNERAIGDCILAKICYYNAHCNGDSEN